MIPNTPVRLATRRGPGCLRTGRLHRRAAHHLAQRQFCADDHHHSDGNRYPDGDADANAHAWMLTRRLRWTWSEATRKPPWRRSGEPAKYDQYKMIDLLKPLAFDDMIQANLNGIRSWRDKGWHEEGRQVILRRAVGKPDAMSNGTLRIAVTICKDQRKLTVVDKKGKKVTADAAQGPDFLENTYDMRRSKGADSFRVYEFGRRGGRRVRHEKAAHRRP